jgi:flagellar basal-body rod protein FlgF
MVTSTAFQKASLVNLSLQESLWPRIDMIASNLSNATTNGFKALIAVPKPVEKKDTESISFVGMTTFIPDMRQGPLKQTGQSLDMAIQGEGFFGVSGNRFTRNGQFKINENGLLSTLNGDLVRGEGGGEISIPSESKSIMVARDGTISNENGILGKLEIVRFDDPKTLKSIGNSLFTSSTLPQPAQDVSIIQGAVEESNVEAISELVNLMQVHRLYEESQKFHEKEDDRKKKLMNVSAKNAA